MSFWKSASLVVALSVLLGFVEAAQIYLGAAAIGAPSGWWRAVMSVMPSWIIFAALVPGIMYLAQRFSLERQFWMPNLLVHTAASVGFSALHLLGTAAVYHTPQGIDAVLRAFTSLVRVYFVLDVLTYFAVVGACHALHYYRALRARELATAQLEASLSEARLQALRSQLDPHFLFNTLNAVSALAAQGKRDEVVDVVNRLSDLLRLALDEHRSQEISLERELQFLNLYLDIQRIRFGDRLAVQSDIAPETRHALVPTMLLQPLVENAVVHGIAGRAGPGRIGIRASRENGRLLLAVDDSGPGFPAGSPPTGIGLSNTRARLEQLYGRDHTFDVGPAPDGGALVSIGIPFRSRERSP